MKTFFQFAFQRPDGTTRFLVVEAETEEQKECVEEAIRSGIDERCILLAAFQGASGVELYNGAFSLVGFAEFMADVAGFESLPEWLQDRVEAAAAGAAEALPTGPSQAELLASALTKMGFGAGVVRKWIKSIGSRAESAPLETLVKDGVRALVSLPAA